MDWGSPEVVIAIIALCGLIAIGKNWIQAKHGYPLTDEWGGKPVKRDNSREVELLTGENDKLRGQVSRLEERLSVLERIATDPSKRLSDEIDGLRKDEKTR